MTTNDMPICDPGGFDALGLVPFQINPHYLHGNPPGFKGETREERIREFGALNPRVWVAGLRECTGLRVILIVVAAWITIDVLQRLIRMFRERLASRMVDPESVKRAATLGRVFRYLVAVVVSLIAGTLVLGEIGISVAPILGAAGVVGLAVGFGAQSLVKDYFAGFFILLEDQIRHGDVVEIAGKSGFVEEITLRYVRLRDYDGNVHYLANGLISTVTNKVAPLEQWGVRREFLRRLKRAFDERGIEIPFPHLTIRAGA